MPTSPEHEALHRAFRLERGLFARTMSRVLHLDSQESFQVKELGVDLTAIEPVERRADTVLLFDGPAGKYVLVVESQTDPDESRRRRWPFYVAYLHDKHECPVVLLVVCGKKATAQWARKPTEIGLPGLTSMTVTPMVLGPDNMPAVTDAADASDDVYFAMLSALIHSRGPKVGDILEALAAALDTIDTGTAAMLAEFTEGGLGDTAGQQIWRALMATQTFPYVSQLRSQGREEGRQEGRQEGRAEGEAIAVLRVLDRRGIVVDDDTRQRILSCTEIETLGTWLDRSLTAEKVSELFA